MSNPAAALLTPAWKKLKSTPKLAKLWKSQARFIVAACGRRSCKSEMLKRRIVRAAMTHSKPYPGRYVIGAPTMPQVKEIYWKRTGESIVEFIPDWAIEDIRETDLSVRLKTGTVIQLLGMDKPQRAEGSLIDGAGLDEFQQMRPEAWTSSIRPALSSLGREGWAMFIGRPFGRNHFYDLFTAAQTLPDWEAYTWPSWDILDPKEIEAARRDLDELSFAQEFGASFVNFAGRAYYTFEADNIEPGLRETYYNKKAPLNFTFDFNVEPGTAGVVQEITHKSIGQVTACIGEVWIPRVSNTPAVCRKLIADWGTHEGPVYGYGDPTGGARGSAKTAGSDWDQIRDLMRAHFGDRYQTRIKRHHPPQRVLVNALNARIRTADGRVHLLADAAHCKQSIKDFEGTVVLEGGAGELNKSMSGANKWLTHLTDGISHYVESEFPLNQVLTNIQEIR